MDLWPGGYDVIDLWFGSLCPRCDQVLDDFFSKPTVGTVEGFFQMAIQIKL